MHLNCPHCHNPIEVVEEAAEEVACPSCGSSIQLDPTRTRSVLPAGPRRLGRFELLEMLGTGGFGTVYKARDTELDRTVAIKIPRAGNLDLHEGVDRFLREARAAAQLNHPRIVSMHDAGQHDGTCYLVSEYIAGATLADRLAARPFSFREAAELLEQVSQALDYAHRQGVIHRDLKPSNIMLDLDGQPHVMDFGLAKREAGEITMTHDGHVLGTPAYMSPEQARGEGHDVDARSDIYSLGVILYELLTGERPFRGNKRMLLVQVLTDEPRPPRRLNDHIPRDLETITLKCLAKEPGRRYATAGELAQELRRWLDGEAIQARPIGKAEHFWRWVKRNPRVAALNATILFLLTGIAIGSSVGMFLIAGQRLEVERQKQLVEGQRDRAVSAEGQQKAEAEKAKRSEADALAVLKFFEDKVLAAARPKDQEGGLGHDATIRAAVDAAEPQIGSAFGERPLVEASIRNTLGWSYVHLGETALSIPQFERGLKLRQEQLGPDHPDTLTSMDSLASAYQFDGRLDEAVPLFERALEKRKAVLGPDHTDTLTSMHNLANVYQYAGKLDLAVPLGELTVEKKKAKFGRDDLDTLNSMNCLAVIYEAAGKYPESVSLHNEILEKRMAKLGPDHPETLLSMNNLAGAYRGIGEFAQTLSLQKQALEKQTVTLGPDHPKTLLSMSNLAMAYQAVGQKEDALRLCEATLEKRKAKLGPDHPDTLVSMNNLAIVYEDAGKSDQAVHLYAETLERMKAKLGPDHPDTLLSTNNLATAYAKAGKFEQALPLFEQTLENQKVRLSPDHPRTLLSMSNLAATYKFLGKLDHAIPLHEETLQRRKATLGNNHADTLLTMDLLAGSYQAAGRLGDAEQLWRDLAALWKEKAGADSPQYSAPLASLGSNLLQQRKPTEAEPILRECLLIREKTQPDDWRTFNASSLLGASLLGQKKYGEAEPLLLAGYEGMKAREEKLSEENKRRLTEAALRLVELYDAWGKPEEANKWRQKLSDSVKGTTG